LNSRPIALASFAGETLAMSLQKNRPKYSPARFGGKMNASILPRKKVAQQSGQLL
jgi:hypothetical protein